MTLIERQYQARAKRVISLFDKNREHFPNRAITKAIEAVARMVGMTPHGVRKLLIREGIYTPKTRNTNN